MLKINKEVQNGSDIGGTEIIPSHEQTQIYMIYRATTPVRQLKGK